MLDTLSRWNRWGRGRLDSGRRRRITAEMHPFLHTPEAVALIGPRRSGKTTILYQLMDSLERDGVPPEAMLHMNLEEPELGSDTSTGLLDQLYETWRTQVYPEGRGYVFLDEIQRIDSFERWVRARTESDGAKIFLTGSSSALMSRELASLLTGRHVTFSVSPLSFSEFLDFTGREVPEQPALLGADARYQRAALDYLNIGGFPEVVLSDSEERRHRLLVQYFDDILFKDIALRHDVRNLGLMRSLAVTLFQETASLHSFNRLARRLDASVDRIKNYSDHLREAFMLDFLPYSSNKVAEQQRRPRKTHAMDTGLRNAVSRLPDLERVAETAAWRWMSEKADQPLAYWKGRSEVDLVYRTGGRVNLMVQVVHDPADSTTLKREIKALDEAAAVFPESRTLLVHTLPLKEETSHAAQMLWQFLLDPLTVT